jgi:hypothetical protein
MLGAVLAGALAKIAGDLGSNTIEPSPPSFKAHKPSKLAPRMSQEPARGTFARNDAT